MTAPHALVQQLEARRSELGLTGADIQEAVGVTSRALRYWAAGRNDPTLTLFSLVARAHRMKLVLVPDGDAVSDQAGPQIPFGELILDDNEKYCRGCDQIRPRREFYVDRSRKDGVQSRCKFCVTERNERRRASLETSGRGEGAA